MIICQQVDFLEQMYYNIYTTDTISYQPIASQKNISYHYLSPARLLLRRWYFVIGGLAGLYFWDRNTMGRKKRPIADYYDLALSKGFTWLGKELPSTVREKTVWKCTKGHEWMSAFDSIQRGRGCPYCAGLLPKLIKDYHDLAEKRGFTWLGPEVANTKYKTGWQCQKGHKWEGAFTHIKQGKGCPYCAGTIRKSIEDYHALAIKRGLNWLGPEVTRNNAKTGWQCQVGHRWMANYSNIQQGYGCPYCTKIAPKTVDDYHNLARDRGFIWLGSEAIRVRHNTKWQCQKGHIWEARFNNIQQGKGCPLCRQSKGEETVASFLDNYGISYNRQKRFIKCRDKGLLSFDFYINKWNILIEYDGIQHSEQTSYGVLEDIQRRDTIKTKFAQDNGFILIRISYTVKNIESYLQFELEKYLSFSLDQLRNQPERPQPKIKPINPYQWKQGELL